MPERDGTKLVPANGKGKPMQATKRGRNSPETRIALKIGQMQTEWRMGRATSPDEHDYVAAACDVLGLELPDDSQSIADGLYDDFNRDSMENRDIARWLMEVLGSV